MNQLSFYTLMKQKISQAFRDHRLQLTYHPTSFSMHIQIDDVDTTLHLNNLFKEYTANPDMFSFEHVIEPLKRMIGKNHHYEKHQLFPVVRSDENPSSDYVSYSLAPSIELRFVIDRPDSVTFVTQNELSETFTAETLYETSFINLIHQGWTKEQSKEKSEKGDLFLFNEKEVNYQGQFLFSPLFSPHLGDRFYVAFPTRSVTLVYRPKEEADSLEHLLKLKELAVNIYREDSYPVSDKVFEVKNDTLSYCG